ncbi:MAG: hypothetical protein HYW91_00305 [Candidatus Sungbacteria bacterium]|nr:hypothetical protein [Candidatus Sungbacteria bacterium]
MSETGQPEKYGPGEVNRELRLRNVFENTLPELLALITIGLRGLQDAIPPDDRGMSLDTTLDQLIKFLERLDRHTLENKICRELAEGDDTLAVSFLTLIAVRGHLDIEDKKRKIVEAAKEGIKLSAEGQMVLDAISGAHDDTESALMGLLDGSKTFGRRFGADDLWEFIREDERRVSDLQRHGMRAKRVGLEKAFLERILSRDFQKGDRDKMRSVLDQQMQDGLSLAELDIISVLQEKPEMRRQISEDVQGLLKLYQIRKFVDQVIPEQRV